MNGFSHNQTSLTSQLVEGAKLVKNIRLSTFRKVFSLMGKNEKIAIGVLSLLALVSLFFSFKNFYYKHTVPAPARGGTYIEGMMGQPSYINPLLAHQETDWSLVHLVYSGLYKYDGDGQLVADLADGSPAISDDQKQYTINLKRNAQWHNGKPVTADDIVFTIQTLKDPDFKSPLRNLWLSTSVDKLTDYSVRFTTKDISSPFIQNLTLPILPKALWSKSNPSEFTLDKMNLEAVGSGPYAIKEISKLPSGKVQSITFQPWTGHASGQAKIDKLVIKFFDTDDDMLNALHSGDINGFGYMPLGSSLYVDKSQQNVNLLTLPLPQYQVAYFNLSNKILSDVNVRKALELATNRQEIINQVFKDNALLPRSPLLFNQSSPQARATNDTVQAGQILDAAGWKLDAKSGFRMKKNQVLELNLKTNDFLANSKAAELLANQWRAVNVKVNLSVLATKDLSDNVIKTRSFDVLLFPQKFGADPDPFLFWHSSQIKDPGFNLTGFNDPAVDKLIGDARTTTDKQITLSNYAKLAQILSDQVPAIYLDQTVFMYAVSSEVKNIQLKTLYEANQRFYDIPNWYIDQKRVWK